MHKLYNTFNLITLFFCETRSPHIYGATWRIISTWHRDDREKERKGENPILRKIYIHEYSSERTRLFWYISSAIESTRWIVYREQRMRIIENRLTRLTGLTAPRSFLRTRTQRCFSELLEILHRVCVAETRKSSFPYSLETSIFERFRRSRFSPSHTSEFLNFRGLKRNDATSLTSRKVRKKHEEKCRVKNNER